MHELHQQPQTTTTHHDSAAARIEGETAGAEGSLAAYLFCHNRSEHQR